MKTFRIFSIGMFLLGMAMTGFSQNEETREPLKLSGPRFGITVIGGDMAKYMETNDLSTYMSQFGWQFETRYFQTKSGYQGLFEFVPLIGGLESKQSALSMNLLVGFRTPLGLEVGVGPNFAVRGFFADDLIATTSMLYAIGYSFKVDEVNIPINLAFSPSSIGSKVTVLVGFNIRQREQ
ncbi:MAG: hypothetical protein R3D00_26270 [Bacteroidia bacterium]